MLKKFEVRNYKNFKEKITIDFGNVGGYQFSKDCIINDRFIGKMLIYGRNATGKSNLGAAMMDIRENLFGSRYWKQSAFLNADSSEEYASFYYAFQFVAGQVIYRYSKTTNCELQYEELLINDKRLFFVDFSKRQYCFNAELLTNEDDINFEQYQKYLEIPKEVEEKRELSCLRWILNNAVIGSNSILNELGNFIARMNIVTTYSNANRRLSDSFVEYLEDDSQLRLFERFLNQMGVECKLDVKKLPEGRSELYFKHKKLIPFYETASSGTLALLNLYRRIIGNINRISLLYIDEFDAFLHYEMAEKLVEFLKTAYPESQIIMTSHNTNLMTNRLMRPDCLFILSKIGELTSLADATQRELREGHNLEKMYISGEFERYE